MKLRIELDCDNDAFQPDPEFHAGDILHRFGRKLMDGTVRVPSTLQDCNGNTVGHVVWEDKP